MKNIDLELVELLQSLIRIPSWVPDNKEADQNENKVVDFLEEWLQKNTDMEVLRQELPGGRFNLIARKGKPDIVFLAHTDTVKPSIGAPYDQLAAEIHDEKIWGLGSTDMKSGIASMIQAIKLVPKINNLWLFLYADEEYDFLGMKHLISKFGDIKPKLIVSSDGSDLNFGHGCRGLIEFRGRFIGKTGHPARSGGLSAISIGFDVLAKLKAEALQSVHPVMGAASFNIAYVLGGARQESISETELLVNVGQAGNVVPDVMEFVLDVRPASAEVTCDHLIDRVTTIAQENGLSFELVKKTHDYNSWYTDFTHVQKYIEIAKRATGESDIGIDDPGGTGYLDLQMFWESVGKPPAFMFGGGVGNTAHEPEEHILVSDLLKTRNFFAEVLRENC